MSYITTPIEKEIKKQKIEDAIKKMNSACENKDERRAYVVGYLSASCVEDFYVAKELAISIIMDYDVNYRSVF